jgi:hypothetical protein
MGWAHKLAGSAIPVARFVITSGKNGGCCRLFSGVSWMPAATWL